jgi:hypothetical protein
MYLLKSYALATCLALHVCYGTREHWAASPWSIEVLDAFKAISSWCKSLDKVLQSNVVVVLIKTVQDKNIPDLRNNRKMRTSVEEKKGSLLGNRREGGKVTSLCE